MRRALDLAAEAAEAGEVPVGAVVTLGDEIVAEARNAADQTALRSALVDLAAAALSWADAVRTPLEAAA